MKDQYVDTKINTKFGLFNIRVYNSEYGKETVVLWTDNIRTLPAPITRIHSECMTGDTFGSLQCDCGKQLEKSLNIINKEGGILIYLRQEGRGIGLFEKIRTYQLQSQGHDTFEANILLGHRPDARSYEMVKVILGDLSVSQIQLLTNNPVKISEVAKLGIEIKSFIPICTRTNKYNHKYLITKKEKFQHFNMNSNYYFYQFQACNKEHVEEIGEFLRDKIKDPLLRIYVGIHANDMMIGDQEEIERIQSIFLACSVYPNIIPVLHFSFLKAKNIIDQLDLIKRNLPFVDHLQINDLKTLDMKYLNYAKDLFQIYLPIDNINFNYVNKKSFRNFLKKNHVFIILDNSKGKGIQEFEPILKDKINTLLNFGLNNICICGGFGPDNLHIYFSLRRYFRINLSIDAETRLKSNNEIDIEKIKIYLLQLIRFDDPKEDGISQTRNFLEQNRREDWEETIINKNSFLIHPKVFHAGVFPSTAWFANVVSERVKNMNSFCEVGCGSGIISCCVALKNPKVQILATDINPYANQNTKLNAERLKIENQMQILTGDVFDGISNKQLFDCIFWALPFGFLDPGTKVNLEEMQVFDPGYRAVRKFFKDAKNYLKPHGELLLGFSTDLGHFELLNNIAKDYGLKFTKVCEKDMHETKKCKFELLKAVYN